MIYVEEMNQGDFNQDFSDDFSIGDTPAVDIPRTKNED